MNRWQDGRSGLVVVAAEDAADRARHFIRHASQLTGRPLRADETAVAADVAAAERAAERWLLGE